MGGSKDAAAGAQGAPLEVENAGALDLLDALSCPVILLSSAGLVSAAARSARRLLGPDLMIRGGRLIASDRNSNELLQSLIRTSLTEAPLAGLLPPVLVRQHEKRPLVIQALSAPDFLIREHDAAAVLVLTGLDVWPELPEPRLKLLFGLTRSEARLAAQVATGQPLERAAEELQISLGTARNHLKSIFSKTDTSRQGELVALLWRAAHLAVSPRENS